MIKLLRKFSSLIGIDGAIWYTLLGRVISVSGGVLTLIFIALSLTIEEQGYYYTFGSIMAIQIFFELGLNGIITQYAAHEIAHLDWKSETELTGKVQNISRISSLLHFCIKVFTSIAFFLFVLLEIIGSIFFTKYHNGNGLISWQFPWMLVALGTSLMFLINPLLAFIEGLGKVQEIARLRFFQQTFNFLSIGLVLTLGGKLWALGVASLVSSGILVSGILFSYQKKLLVNIYKSNFEWRIKYWEEIFPYQWKIAISWASGYFIFQLFIPVLFATEGPTVAGKMGMTLAALNGIQSISLAWIITKIPIFSGFIAKKEYSLLDRMFNKTLKQSSLINFCALGFLLLVVFLFKYYKIELNGKLLGNRFLNYLPLVLMMVPVFLNQFTAAWATYLRCHKQEPFLLNSLVGGILCALSTVFFSKYFGILGVTSGYCIITMVLFPWGYHIFKTKKLKWHG